ncbi:DUF551 domain-containing protein, partial [Klebsiella pneumoniae]|nr:DUF551 domain-containing protein [Klebsiella pneumoniae]
MTKSTITRERLQELAAGQSGFNLRTATHEESQELARMALAAMDSEPVAWIRESAITDTSDGAWRPIIVMENKRTVANLSESWGTSYIPLYSHAQPAPAVPGKWIPVSERMPEDRTQVILWDAEIGEVTSGHYSHKTQTFYHCGDAIENEITHWM